MMDKITRGSFIQKTAKNNHKQSSRKKEDTKMKRVIFKAFFSFLMVGTICCIPGIPKASEGKDPIRLYCLYPPQVELISARGTRVLIDVHDPKALSSPPTEKDVSLTTH